MSTIEVEIWSDYVCPFCYIGKRQLEQAIAATGLTGKVDVKLKAYELDPTTPKDSMEPVHTVLARKYGTTPEKAKEMSQGVAARAAEVGLQYDVDGMLNQNTLDAHRLVKYAETVQKDGEFAERLMKAYFTEGQAIGQYDVLVKLALEVGLNLDDVRAVLADTKMFNTDIEQDKAIAQQLQVRGVPFFVINKKYGIAGAQPQEVFNDTLREVAKEEGITPGLIQKGGNVDVCSDDGCSI